MKVVVGAFNQEKALVGAFSVIVNLRMDLFEALLTIRGILVQGGGGGEGVVQGGHVLPAQPDLLIPRGRGQRRQMVVAMEHVQLTR